MNKYIAFVKTYMQGSVCEEEFEMPDNATEEEIEEAAREAAFNNVDWWWEKIDKTE
jgi:hypothetical protein